MSFDVWTYVARMGSRMRPAPDPFFSDGDAVCQMRTCQYITVEDEEELLHKDFEEFDCPIQGCNAKFSQLLDSEVHYATKHRHACSVCKRSLPSAHLLELHVVENHDTFFQVLAEKRPSYECFLETCTKKFWNPDERKDHSVKDHDFPSNFKFDSGAKRSGVKKKKSQTTSVDYEPMDLEDSISPISKQRSDKKPVKKSSFRVAASSQECMECSKVDKREIQKSPQGRPPYVTQRSEDPSNLRRNSLSATPAYHKHISLDGSKSQPNSPEKRGPVSLAKMGLGLTSKSNRHSVCIAAMSSVGPSSSTASPVLGNKKSSRENVDQSVTTEANEVSLEFSPFRRRVYTSGSKSNIPQLIARSSPAKKPLSVNKRSSMPCSSASSSTTASSPSPRLSMKMRSGGIASQSSNGSSPEHSKTYMSPVTSSSLQSTPLEYGSPSKSRIPVLRSSSVKVPKSICFGFGVKKAFAPSKNWYQIGNAEKTRADYLSQPDFVDDMRMALN